MIHIYDANNYVRRFIESDDHGETPRTLLYKMLNPEAQSFFVWDATNGLKARRAIFPDYKVKRAALSEDVTVNFDLVHTTLLHSRAVQIQVPGFEADDVVASLARNYASRGEKVHIFSTDRDFLQLAAEYPTLISCDAALKTGVMLADVRYHKTLVGDASDSIPGMKGFGEKKWTEEIIPHAKRWLDSVVTEGAEVGPFPWAGKACENWAAEPENQQLLKSFWEIIGFLPVTERQIIEHMQVGDGDYNAANAKLAAFLQ